MDIEEHQNLRKRAKSNPVEPSKEIKELETELREYYPSDAVIPLVSNLKSIDSLEEEIKMANDNFSTLQYGLKTQLDSLKKKLNVSLPKFITKLNNLQSINTELGVEATKLEESLNKSKKEIKQKQKRIVNLEAKQKSLESELNEVTDTNEKLSKTVKGLKEKMKSRQMDQENIKMMSSLEQSKNFKYVQALEQDLGLYIRSKNGNIQIVYENLIPSIKIASLVIDVNSPSYKIIESSHQLDGLNDLIEEVNQRKLDLCQFIIKARCMFKKRLKEE